MSSLLCFFVLKSNSEFPLMDDFEAKGKSLLIHSSTLQSYLTLLGDSQNTSTQEACCGALHNLTAKKGIVRAGYDPFCCYLLMDYFALSQLFYFITI